MSSTIVPASQIAALKTGLDSILNPIKQALENKVWAENLPIVGSLISSAASQGQAALQQFGSLETNVFNALNGLDSVDRDISTVQGAINTALVNAGFPTGGVVLGLNSAGTLTAALNDTLSDTFSTALDSSFGLPGLGFQTSGTAATLLTYDLDVIGTVDTAGNFSVSEPKGAALTVALDVTAPKFAATGTLGSGDDTILGNLRFGAIDQGSSLHGSFSLDTGGGATFTGNAALDVGLSSDMGTAALPSVSANLTGGWSFEASNVGVDDAASFGDAPTIALDNVTFKLGSFIDNVIDPIIDGVNSVLQSAPIQALETLFETPLAFLGGAGHLNHGVADPDSGLLGNYWHSLDVAGSINASGADVGDGTITLVDFLQIAENLGAPIDVPPLVQFLSALNQVQQWVSALAGAGTSFGGDTYNLGSFTIPDDVRSAAQLISQVTPELIPGSQPIDLPTMLQNLVDGAGGGGGAADGASGGSSASSNPFQALQSLLNSNIFSFPIITNPAQAVQFLLGGTADLFDANLPAASFNFGSINAAGSPVSTIQLLDVPIPVFPFIDVDLALSAAFQGSVALDFGYDTSGISAFKNSGFTNYATLLSGLFVQSPTVSGTVEPLVHLAGDVQAGATLNALGASASVSGDIGGVLDLNFSQPGKNYLNTLLTKLESGNPFSAFNASGQITAGFELVARALTFSPFVFPSQRLLLASFGGGGEGGASGPTIPANTTWVGGASGDFETAANWNPDFAAIGGTDYYGDATIAAGSAVTFQGTAAADLTSLTLAANSVLSLAHGQLTIEDSTIDSANSGTIIVGGTADLVVAAGFKNTGTIALTGGTLVASGLMDLTGGGKILLPNTKGSFIQSSDPNALLWNEDNTVSGGGTIGADLLNGGTINANVSTPLVLAGLDTNNGLLEATGNSGAAGTPHVGGLDIDQSLDNTGGTLAAFKHGVVVLESGVTVTGGTLETGSLADASLILAEGSVTLDGGTTGLTIAGAVLADNGATLTLTGLIDSGAYSATLGQSQVASGGATVLLQGATIHNGFLDALQPTSGGTGTMAVSGTATLDGSAGDGSIGIDGIVQVRAGNTLVVDGSVNPGLSGGGIDLAGGTLVIGNGIVDAATFGASLPGSDSGTGGTLTMVIGDDSVVTGADAGSSLTNNWYIQGSGNLGNGQLAIINTANGTIAAGFGTLVIDGGVPMLNAGVIEAALGALYLKSDVANAGGTIESLALDSIFIDGVTIAGGALSGGGLFFGSLSDFLATGHAMLDGTASPVTLEDAANLLVDAGATLTLAGSIDNGASFDDTKIAVQGNASVGGIAVLQASGTVTLSGGGLVSLTETSGAGTNDTQEITGVSGDTLDNVDNRITGYGSIGVGDNTLTLVNEANGTINANTAGDTLVLNTGSHTVTNHGLLEATNGGTLDLHGSIANAGATLLAADGTALLDGATLSGGTIASSGTGSVRAIGTATLDGKANAITVAAGADVAVDSGDTLTAVGTIVNNGDMHSTGGTLVVTTGAIAVANNGRLGADANGVLDLHSNVSNAGGTIAVTTGDVLLDGMKVTNGLLAGESPDTGFIDVVNSATVIGTGTVAAGVTTSPTTGLLNTADLRVQGGDTLTLQGTITNRGIISLLGTASASETATLHTSGTVKLTGGGTLTMQDSSAAESPESQLVTGTATSSTLDNIDNTISGEGLLGNADGLFTLINEAAGTVDAVGTSLIVNTGTHAIVNKGLLESTTGVLFLNGTVTNTGTIAANGGAVALDDATVNGGMLATSAGGEIGPDGSATLNGSASAVTLASGARVITGGANTLTLEGSIVNHGVLGLQGDSTNNLAATLKVLGTVTLSGGGHVSLTSIDGTPSASLQVITDPVAGDTLDNIDNTIAGYGQIGGGALIVHNETAGIFEATGGALVINTGTSNVINKGLFAAVGGTLELQNILDSTGGGTLQALDLGVGGAPGIILLDGGTLRGGTLLTDLTDPASHLTVSTNGGTLDGTAGAVTLAAGAQALVGAGTTLTLTGSITNHGTLGVAGDSSVASVATLRTAGTTTLSGGGVVSLYSVNGGPSSADQIITGATATAKLDNVDNTISGYGTIEAGQFKLVNEAAGTIEAVGGTLVVNTGTNAVTNHSLMQGVGGTLVVQGVIDGTGGGTVATLDQNLVAGIVVLDGGTLLGGTLRTDTTDPTSQLQETANGGTLDGTTLAPGAVAAVVWNSALTLEGTIVNHGTLAVLGYGGFGYAADMLIAGSVALAGGGLLRLQDASGANADNTQIVTGTNAGAVLDNIDNLVSGYGTLGNGLLTLRNETKGVIDATGGELVVNTAANTVTNHGLMEAAGGTLLLQSAVDDTSGGTIAALNNAGLSGVVLLDGATLRGGTIRTDLTDTASMLGVTANGGTLDGTAATVSIVAGAQVETQYTRTLTLDGTINNQGTMSVLGYGAFGYVATDLLGSNVTLTGSGTLALTDVSGAVTSNTQIVTGAAPSDTLDNVANTISGYGSLGAGSMTLINAPAGTIAATGGLLLVDTGANTVTNQGLLEAVAGTLQLDSVVTNSGTVAAGAGGNVVIDRTVNNSGLVSAANTGTVTLVGTIADTTGSVQVAGGGTMLFDGGLLSNGTLTNAASGTIIDLYNAGGTLSSVAVHNAGSLEVTGYGAFGYIASLDVAGTVTLSGGGVVSLSDVSGAVVTASQVITGIAPGDKLDNFDNTIVGYGELGAGQLTLVNETKGTIEAAVGNLVLNTGAVATINHGLVEAVGGVLTVQSVVDSTTGGTVAAQNSATVSGDVVLDGGTLRGGTVTTSLTDPGSALLLTTNGGTLDGTAGSVTIAAGAHVDVLNNQTLTLEGAIAEQGTVNVLGYGAFGYIAAVDIGGTVTLSGGGKILLSDASGADVTASQVITGTAPGAELNTSALISGYGSLGAGSLALINEATGTIEATGGALIVDPGANTATNKGQMLATSGTLQINSTLTNTGTITAGAGGDLVVAGTIDTTGLIAAAATGTITVLGTIADPAGLTQIGNGGTMLLDGGVITGGTLSNAATGTIIDIYNAGGTLGSIAVSNAGTAKLIGYGAFGYIASLAVAGTVTLSGGGVVSLSDVSGADASNTQVISGVAPGDTLDNIDNTIRGYGELGNGLLTLINETKGTIEATGGALVVNTGAVALTNHGLIEAAGGTLVVQTVVDDTSGGAVAALSSGGLAGIVLLDGGTVRGGTVATSGAGSAVLLSGNGGTLDGSAGTLTLAVGSQATVTAIQTLTLAGSIVEQGTLNVQGYGVFGEIAAVDIAGTVTLSGSGRLALSDISGAGASNTQVITGTAAGAQLDNAALIVGYGSLGNGSLAVVNQAAGTIDAIGGDLVVDAGPGVSVTNAGLMQAVAGTLDVVSNLVNTGMVLVNAGTVVLEGAVTGTGVLGLESANLVLDGSVAAGQTIDFFNFGTAETLDLANPQLVGATLSGFATKDTIVAEGTILTGVTYHATTGTLGVLSLLDGATTVGTLTLAGTYTNAQFKLTNVAGNPSIITTTATAGPLLTHASASTATPTTKNFGTHHVGDVLSQAVTIKNNAAAGSFTENLDVGFVATTGGGIGSGSITGLAAGVTNNTSLSVGLSTALDGAQSGTAILTPSSDGTGVDGFGVTPLTSQTIAVSGVLYNYATASAAPVDFGEHHTGDTLSQKLAVTNTGTNDGFTENLDASLGGATGAATGSGSFTALGAQIANTTSLTIGVNATKDGLRTGTTVLTLHSDGAGIDGLASTLLTAQTIAATGTIFNYATASIASKSLGLGAHHVGDTLTGTLSITNSGTADGFTENLDVSVASTTGALTAAGTVTGLGAGKSDITSVTLGLPNTGDGTQTGKVVLSLISDGAGIDNLGTTVLTAQTITATGTLYNYATASAATPAAVDFGTHHVGDTLSQALSISNTGVADGFTEKLDGSFGTTTGAATGTGSFIGLAAGKASSLLLVGLSNTQDGVHAGTAALTLKSDGTGVDGLGTTILTAQTIATTGTLYNYATASTAASVNLGNHHLGDTIGQALTIANTGTADGFTENLDASLGGATGAATASGSITGLAAEQTVSTGLTIGVTTTKDGVQSGKAVLTLHSDGTGIDGLASTLLTAQTITATGTIYNYATANTVAPVNFGNRHVGDALSQALSISNIGTTDGFTETLDASIGGAAGAVTASGSLSGLAAGISNASSLIIGMSSALDGAHSGTAALTLKSDGTGVDGLGTTVLTAQTIAATGTLYNFATASAVSPGSVNFGIHHVGDTLSQALSISNIGTADGFTENLDAAIGATTGAGAGSGSFSGLVAGATNGTAVAIGLSTTHDGVQTGTTALTLKSDGAGIDGLGSTVLTAQTIAVTGTLYNYATANVVGVVNLGAHHVGDAISKSLSITNTGPVDAFTEALDASLGGASAGAFASGSLNLDAPGHTNSTNLSVGLTSTTEGNHSGTATLTLASDGSLVDGLGKTSLVAQTVTMTAAVFGYATPILSASTLDFGAVRVGGTVAAKSVTISNGATADLFKENLGYSFETPSAGFALASGATGTVAAGAAGATASWTVVTSTAGKFTTGTDVVDLTSLGAGTSGLANTALTSQKVTLLGKVYAPAVAKLATIGFGVVHVGDAITVHDEISNIATGALTDVLTGGVGSVTGSAFSVATFGGISLGTIAAAGLAAGGPGGDLAFAMNTGTAGVFSGSASLVLASHDSDLADIPVTVSPILLSGTVDNYAAAALEEVSGGGVFKQTGSNYTLDLGTIASGAAAPTVTIGALNAASGLADLLSGNFLISGDSVFLNSGTVAFSGLGAGQADTAPTISLATTLTGTFSETLTLTATGSNSSGYSGTLAPETLTITGTVIAGGPGDAWLADASGNFDDASQWTAGIVPGITNDATINFADDPKVLHNTGSDSVHSLSNIAGDFVMSGGTLGAGSLANDALMGWTGGSLLLNSGTGGVATLLNAAGASLTIAGNGQRLSATGTGTASASNAGTITATGGSGSANIDVKLINTGVIAANQGTLSLNAGGSSNGYGLQGGAGGTLQFGLPASGPASTFTVTGGEYAVGNTTVDGGVLDLSAASAGIFFVDSLRLAGAGTLLLGAQNATAQSGFVQGPTTWAGATGIPFLSGSGTLTVFGGGSLINGVESGAGLTRLIGTNQIGAFDLDGGRTVENDGWMTWSSGNIALGAGDAAAATHSGTIANMLGATFYVTANGRIGNPGAGASELNNAGVTAVIAGIGETDIDATVNNPGYIQAQSGTLSLNGGGSSAGDHLFVAANAVVQFGTKAGGAAGGVFAITGGQYTAGDTAITGGTLDVSAASGAVFANQLAITAGALQLGSLGDGVDQGALQQSGGLLKGSGLFTVFGGGALMGGVQSGPAITRLYGTNVLGGSFALDGGRTVENDGWMNWSSGNITLGSGDASAATHTGTITNVSGSVFYVTSDGRIGTSGAAGGTLNNAGVLAVFAGAGETDIDAYVNDTGHIQAQSGVLGLNGGGTADAGNLFVATNAVVQFGTMAATGTGGTFVFNGGPYIGSTVVNGSTVDLSAVSGVSFAAGLTVSAGALLLGGNYPLAASFVQTGGELSGTGILTVASAAVLSGGLETGSGRTDLQGGGSISGPVAFDGGRSLENDGTLAWTGGSITLGGGDSATADHSATLINTAVFDIETNGTINGAGFAGTGAVGNTGTILSDGIGTTAVYANLFNDGVVDVTSGTLALELGVAGTGTFNLGGAATLDFVQGAASSETMQFLHPGGTLEVDSAGQFGPTISGFAAGDVIDAGAVGFVTGTTAVGFNAGTLTVTTGAQSAAFIVAGSYAAGGFHIIGADGHGGTDVGYS